MRASGILLIAVAVVIGAGCAPKTPAGPPPIVIPSVASTATPAAPTATATATPTASPSGPGPAPAPIPAGFSPLSVTFISLRTGWVLGATCATCTVTILRTRDGGATWARVPAPPVVAQSSDGGTGVRSLRFADVNNGWAFGPDLWVTHDGGANWARSPVPSAGPVQVFDLAAAGGVVHAAVFAAATAPDINIMSAAVAGDDWTVSPTKLPVGAGPVPKVQIELHGSAGWLIQNDRVVVNGARLVGGAWVPWTPPCAGAGGPATLAASTPLNLAAVCVQGIYTGPTVTVAAYLSTDGSTFAPPAHPLPVGSDVQGAASPVPNSLVVADMATLTASFNGAAAWSNVFAGAPNQSWHDLGFTSPTQGVVIAAPPAPAAATLVMTHDGGRTWAPVPFTQG